MDRRSLGKRAVKRVSSTFASFPGESAAVDLASTGPQACGPAGNASNSEEYQDQADEGLKYDSEDDSQDDDDMENVSPSLTESLCGWAVHFRVSLVALTALLAILRVYHLFYQKMSELYSIRLPPTPSKLLLVVLTTTLAF